MSLSIRTLFPETDAKGDSDLDFLGGLWLLLLGGDPPLFADLPRAGLFDGISNAGPFFQFRV